jgi:magnesium chelatase subunit D
MTADVENIAEYWQRALTAAAIVALDAGNMIGGAILRAPHGVARDVWLNYLHSLLPIDAPSKRLPTNISDARLLGGLDLAATLFVGKPIAEVGLLAQAHQGLIVIPMAERLPVSTAAKLAQVIDSGMVNSERDGFRQQHASQFRLVMLDETDTTETDTTISAALADRLAFHLDLSSVPCQWLRSHDGASTVNDVAVLRREDIEIARAHLPFVIVNTKAIETLVTVAASFGLESLRAPLLALNVAKLIAALNLHDEMTEDDLKLAAQYVLSPRALTMPQLPEDAAEEVPNDTPQDDPQQTQDAESNEENKPSQDNQQPLEDVVLEAVAAVIPEKLRQLLMAERINQLAGNKRQTAAGRAGHVQHATQRGRVIGTMQSGGGRDSSARLNVLATLRAAAPWQKIRRHSDHGNSEKRIHIRREDFRLNRYQQRSKTTTIFVVDASGSSAMNRLAEAKGAVELLLADCYIRRDEVAVIAFRGKAAEILLPPTRSLVRAKRSLAALPGGGGTPLAAGLDAARQMADGIQRQGDAVMVVVLTDGRANVNRFGAGDRAGAAAEAIEAAKAMRQCRIKTLMIDTSPNRNPQAAEVAHAMNAIYLPLPYAEANTMAAAVAAAARQ